MAKIKIGIYYEIAYDGEIEVETDDIHSYFEGNGVDPNNYTQTELQDVAHSYVLDNLDEIQKQLRSRGIDTSFVIEV